MAKRVTVIGAGVIGLSTAVCLAETGHRVQVRSSEDPGATTSAVAGALWGPGGTLIGPAEKVAHWARRTHRDLVELATRPDSGVHLAAGTMASRFDLGSWVPPEADRIDDLRTLGEDELPEGFVSGYQATVPLVDMPIHLDYLVSRLVEAGGTLEQRAVASLADAASGVDVVVNCAGVAAGKLAGDDTVTPVRGEHLVVENPGVTEYFVDIGLEEEFTDLVPHGDRLVLGGVAQEGRDDRTGDEDVGAGILRRCAAIVPDVQEATVTERRVGLRPKRPEVRLEMDLLDSGVPCLHNYGHGGSGVSLSWGCARESVGLINALG